MTSSSASAATIATAVLSDNERLCVEYEFVQSLSNVTYLHCKFESNCCYTIECVLQFDFFYLFYHRVFVIIYIVLAQMKYFNDESFMHYLRYLRYWKQPEYCQHLVFPQCLTFLDALIDHKEFRERLLIPQFRDYVYHQQGLHWLHYSTEAGEVTGIESVGPGVGPGMGASLLSQQHQQH